MRDFFRIRPHLRGDLAQSATDAHADPDVALRAHPGYESPFTYRFGHSTPCGPGGTVLMPL
jgi:hypothetical protein